MRSRWRGPKATRLEASSSSGRHIVLAAGSVPPTPPGLDVGLPVLVTSDEFLDLEHIPASVVVVGGGAIGVGEFASLLS